MRAHSLMEARKRKRRFKRCSLETRQALMTTWMQGRKERTGSGDIRMHSWAGGREERALQSPGVHCSPHSVHLPQPHSSPRVGAACLCLFQAGQDHLPWQGAEWSFQQARGSERAAVPRLGDQLMENSIASWVLQMLKTERS